MSIILTIPRFSEDCREVNKEYAKGSNYYSFCTNFKTNEKKIIIISNYYVGFPLNFASNDCYYFQVFLHIANAHRSHIYLSIHVAYLN
jgi:hypothetical protein